MIDSNYVHMTDRSYLEYGRDSSATRSGDVVRGDVLAIEFECESGHKFEVCFGFHKGNTAAFCRPPA